ncbi:MAG: 50S ribosomal protein L5 [Thermoplasmatota archaeon]
MNEMKKLKIEKITVNIGVGEGGERLRKARQVLEDVTKQDAILTMSKTINKDWDIRKDMPIGCKVTLRGEKAEDFLRRALSTRNNKIADWSFDEQGNVSFGIPDHTDFKEMKYDPSIGVFGMDVCVTIERPGFRVKKRRIQPRKIPKRHRISPEESMDFMEEVFDVEVV